MALGEEGSKSLDDKKKARAARFGMPVATTDAEKLRARADRYWLLLRRHSSLDIEAAT